MEQGAEGTRVGEHENELPRLGRSGEIIERAKAGRQVHKSKLEDMCNVVTLPTPDTGCLSRSVDCIIVVAVASPNFRRVCV